MPPTAPRILRRPEDAAALLDPLRIRLLRHLEFPISASGLARRLHLPRQQVNYHLRELEKRGLLRLVRERKVGNCTERLVQSVAREFVLSPELLGPLAPEPRTLPERTLVRRVSFESPEAREAFEAELGEEMARLAAKHGTESPDGHETWRVQVGFHRGTPQRRRLPAPRLPE